MLALASIASGSAILAQSPVPDLTKGETKDATHDWNLGPTGARGASKLSAERPSLVP